MKYRILIIETDAAWIKALSAELAAITQGDTITITVVRSVAAARLQTARHSPELLLTTLSSDGLALARRLRERAPHMQALFLYDPRTPMGEIEAVRRLGWPVVERTTSAAQLACLAGALLGICHPEAGPEQRARMQRPAATLGDVELLLDVLRRQAQAQLALYTDHIGNTIAQRGDAGNLELAALTSLIAGSFVNSIELGRALRDPETRHLSMLEGQLFDVYATNVGVNRLLALVFAKEFVDPKLGYVWLLLKRGASQLSQMRIAEGSIGEVLVEELSASLNSEFDRLFGSDLLEPHA